MNPNTGSKHVAATQDFARRNLEAQEDDRDLNEAGYALLASIEDEAMPAKLAAAFPGIVNYMARIWKMPREMDRYFDELLTDSNSTGKGFSIGVLMELATLKDYYQTKVFPLRQHPQDSWASGLTDGHR